MSHFHRLAAGLEVAPVLAELDAHPELWGQHPERTAPEWSPHRESEDVWLRFCPRELLREPADYARPHLSEWYPAMAALPSLRPLILDVMRLAEAVHLGGCLLTRIPPGGQIYPHVDQGWHPEYFATKAYVILAANTACINECGGERVYMAPGEAWLFNNLILHSVLNGGDTPRVAAILTMRQ